MQSNALSQHFVRWELISEGAEDVLAVVVAAQLDNDGRGLANNRQVSTTFGFRVQNPSSKRHCGDREIVV
jgi:hypothetical protein